MSRWLPSAITKSFHRSPPLSSGLRIATLREYSLSRSDTMEKIDEESLSDYDPKSYYPVQFNENVGGIFRAKVKLGYGRTSTTWLCTDDKYVLSVVYGWNLPTDAPQRDIQGHQDWESRVNPKRERCIRETQRERLVHGRSAASLCATTRTHLESRLSRAYLQLLCFPAPRTKLARVQEPAQTFE
jgi:hypothetical protein